MKRTKILATYGPAITSAKLLSRLIASGVNAFRINCSHGNSDEWRAAAVAIRKAASKAPYPVGILFDISGPKLRVDQFEGSIDVTRRDTITFTSGKSKVEDRLIAVNHPQIIKSVKKGERLFVDDGNLVFEILSADGREVVCKAVNSGKLLPGKGINLPDTDIGIPTITSKDRKDIKTAVECDADFVALSFVRSGDDIIEARKLIKRYGGRQAVIAKLEKREAIDDLEGIMLLSDGVMVARGDLGVELPPAELPNLQKRIIRMANCHHKPVIVATQMLESMRFSPRATRAEINDVATAVYDFADAVMLSAETATGRYPLEAVKTMSDVILAAETQCLHQHVDLQKHLIGSPIPYAVAMSVSESDHYCETEVIFAFTTTGFTAGLISNLFPPQPVIALTLDEKVMNQLSLYRSVYAILLKQPTSFDDMMDKVNVLSKKYRLARKGDRVVITGGAPFGSTAQTNFMLFHEVG